MTRMHAIIVANLMSECKANVANVRVLIISKPFVIPRLQQPGQHPALTATRSHSCHRDMVLLGATVVIRGYIQELGPIRSNSYIHLVERERMVKYHKTQSFQERCQMKKVCTTGFLALQFRVKWLKAPTLRVSL